jgi:glutamyl-tRNA synthetase
MAAPTPHGTVVTRFAPSPTGHLHIGGARTALFCWAFAQRAEREARARGAAPGTGGRFMIRIEDTDQARSSDESARGILEDLAWLGIEWDDGPALRVATAGGQGGGERVIGAHARPVGPYFQAQRVVLYNKYIRQLVESGKAYPAFETPEELEAKRKAVVAQKGTYKYDRAELSRLPTPEARLKAMAEADAAGRPYVVRFHMPAEDIVVRDQVLGDVVYKHTEGGIDDFVIRKADGFPTYHFAVVIDDETMGVTHVLRAQEHLNNTPRHVALQKALGFRTPVYAHMPLIFNMDGTKMSKRDKAKTARKALKDGMAKDKALTAGAFAGQIGVDEKLLADFLAAENDSLDVAAAVAKRLGVALPEIEIWDFRASGYLPEAIVNFVALLGWNPGMKLPDGKDLEKFDRAFLAEHFSVERIGKTNAKFDRAKLLSFNADAIAALPDAEFERRWRAFLAEYEPDALARLTARGGAAFSTLAAAVKPRARTLRDGLGACRFALTPDADIAYDAKGLDKLRKADDKNGPGPAGPRTGVDLLDAALAKLETLSDADWTPGTINTLLEQAAQQLGVGIGQIAQPLRLAVTGTGVSPGIGETLGVLGRASTLARVRACLRAVRV